MELTTRIGRMLFDLAGRLGAPIGMVSRSDSTLRGHVVAEVRGLDAVRREAPAEASTTSAWAGRRGWPRSWPA